jgi:hypothetical protein
VPAVVIAALEQRSRQILGFFCLTFLLGTCGRASQKLFWHDELFTLYMTRLPGLGDVWRAIADGAEASPPLFAAITRASIGLLGEGLITVRLPAIAGFLIASLAAYVFVTRRCGPIYGLVACFLPTATHAYVYAYEARPYGMVLALTGIAMVSWQRATGDRHRAVSLALLLSSLTAALWSHYYTVLLLIPLALGELARFWRRRTPDWTMWAVLLTPLVALAPAAVLIQSAVDGASDLYSTVRPGVVIESYEAVLLPLAVPAVVILMAIGVATTAGRQARPVDEPHPADAVPFHEWVAAVALMLLPVWGAVASGLVFGTFMPRYAVSWVVGFCITAAFAAATMSSRPKLVGAIALVTLLGWTSAKMASSARLLALDAPTIAEANAALLNERGLPLPIVVTHAHVFFPLVEYAPRDIAARLVLLAGPPRVTEQWGAGTREQSLVALSTRFPIHVEEFDTFITTHRHFLMYGPPMWVTEELRAAGARLSVIAEERGFARFSMSNPAGILLHEVTFD